MIDVVIYTLALVGALTVFAFTWSKLARVLFGQRKIFLISDGTTALRSYRELEEVQYALVNSWGADAETVAALEQAANWVPMDFDPATRYCTLEVLEVTVYEFWEPV